MKFNFINSIFMKGNFIKIKLIAPVQDGRSTIAGYAIRFPFLPRHA